MPQADSPTKRLNRSYLIACILLGFFSAVCGIVVVTMLDQLANDSHVINLAGRQRMFSQKMCKIALRLEMTREQTEFVYYQDELQQAFGEWKRVHKGLQEGDAELGLPANFNSGAVQDLFKGLRPHYEQLEQATENIAQLIYGGGRDNSFLLERAVYQILDSEAEYLSWMDKIVVQYDREAQQDLAAMKFQVWILVAAMMIGVSLVGFVVFRPSAKMVKRYFSLAQEQNTELIERNEELKQSQEEVNAHIEEILASQEAINEQAQMVAETNEALDAKSNQLEDALAKQTASIRYAKRFQNAMLQMRGNLSDFFTDSFLLFEPRDIVSGDFYWSAALGPQKVVIVADCTGHGVPGALMTIIGNMLLSNIIEKEGIHAPHRILEELDLRLQRLLRTSQRTQQIADGMDLGVLVFNADNTQVTYAGAKMGLYHLMPDHPVVYYKGSPHSIGGKANARHRKAFLSDTIALQPGQRLVLASDGFQDQFGGSDNVMEAQKYLRKRFRELLVSIQEFNLAAQARTLSFELDQWRGQLPQTDDVTVMGIEV